MVLDFMRREVEKRNVTHFVQSKLKWARNRYTKKTLYPVYETQKTLFCEQNVIKYYNH